MLAVVSFGACGEEEETQELSFTLTTKGNAPKVRGPARADTGLAELTLVNKGQSEGELQLIRVEGNHPTQKVIDVLTEVRRGRPFPKWFFVGGGIATVAAGKRETVTQVLEPGTYFAADLEVTAPPRPKDLQVIEVSGEEPTEDLPEGEAEVSAFDYGFKAKGLSAGTNEIVFNNVGDQPHHLIATPLIGGATAKDAEQFFKTESGSPPFASRGSVSTTVLEGGEGQVVTLDLEPGRYVLYCFVSDRQGGRDHVSKGMVDEVEVK